METNRIAWSQNFRTRFISLLILMLAFGLLLFSFQSIGANLSASINPIVSGIGIKLSQAGNALAGVHGGFSAGAVLREALLRRIQAPGTWITLLVMLTSVVGLLTASGVARRDTTDDVGTEKISR